MSERMEPTRKKTPSDTTDFEREQLRFFLSREDVAETLAELNPSLAWLPEFARMKVIQSPGQLTPWIEKNFDDPEADSDFRNFAYCVAPCVWHSLLMDADY